MRDLGKSFKTVSAAFGALLGILAAGAPAQAANPLELNFWLSGPKYEGRVAPARRRFEDQPSTSRTRKAPSGIRR